ncbi:uncharacterized protein LOC108478102 [Gossypium arboreum]|uniref:uncharacterized protein LOC108478102 n=1 Tax=Gossypium arboreum TaxID=29729 RepID=UPI0022F158EA|nr:uncharacterized protein LOC108478102 [Gossypium arboreum]
MTIELLSSHHHFMRHRICFSWVSFLMTVNSSPSTHISRKPISSAMVTACTHALASAVVGSVIFSHGFVGWLMGDGAGGGSGRGDMAVAGLGATHLGFFSLLFL